MNIKVVRLFCVKDSLVSEPIHVVARDVADALNVAVLAAAAHPLRISQFNCDPAPFTEKTIHSVAFVRDIFLPQPDKE